MATEQGVVLETDPQRARSIARANLAGYFGLPNYTNNWKRLGFTDAEIADGGSDRLIDALVAWGDESTIALRIQEHRDAGASHVCIQVLTDDRSAMPLEQWRILAPADLTILTIRTLSQHETLRASVVVRRRPRDRHVIGVLIGDVAILLRHPRSQCWRMPSPSRRCREPDGRLVVSPPNRVRPVGANASRSSDSRRRRAPREP